MRQVPFFSFESAPKSLKMHWNNEISKVIDSGVFVGGKLQQDFEVSWGKYLNSSYCLGVGNGYDALYIALKTLGIGPGDLVAVPSHTFIATWLAVGATGATPVAIDCDSKGLIDLSLLEEKPNTFKAVVPVHIHGQMVDMPRLIKWANNHSVFIVEDCAQAHGAEIFGKKAGTWGDFGAFSFYPTKNMGAIGDAGALVTKDERLFEIAKSYANYGSMPGKKYSYTRLGLNSRLDPVQAVVLKTNLEFLNDWNNKRREIANKYSKQLTLLGIPFINQSPNSVFHHFVTFSLARDTTRLLLNEKGVGTEVHYPESAESIYFRLCNSRNTSFSENATQISRTTLSLPMHPWLSTDDIDYVLEILSSERVLASFLGEI